MMNGLAIGVILALVSVVMFRGAATAQTTFQAHVSGSTLAIGGDTNGDGVNAGLVMLSGTSSFGPIISQGFYEFSRPVPATCPTGNPGFQVTPVLIRSNFQAENGDLMFFELSAGTLCQDSTTGIATFDLTGRVLGSLGRFTSVAGSIRSTGAGLFVVTGPAGPLFGLQVADFTVTPTTP